MVTFSQLRQHIHSRKQKQQASKFVAKNVYTSVELTKIRLRAVYSFTRYIDCTIRWLVVTLLSVICVLLVRLVVNSFDGSESVLASAQAAAIDFNSSSTSQNEGQNKSDTHTAIEFPSFEQSSHTNVSLKERSQNDKQQANKEYSSLEWGAKESVTTEHTNEQSSTHTPVTEHTAIEFPSMSGQASSFDYADPKPASKSTSGIQSTAEHSSAFKNSAKDQSIIIKSSSQYLAQPSGQLERPSVQTSSRLSGQSEGANIHQARSERLQQVVQQMRDTHTVNESLNNRSDKAALSSAYNAAQSGRPSAQDNGHAVSDTRHATQAQQNARVQAHLKDADQGGSSIRQSKAFAKQEDTFDKQGKAFNKQDSSSQASTLDSARFPSTLIDVNQLQKQAQQQRQTQEALLNTGDLLVRSLFALVVAWRLLALYCIYHGGQGVVINFQKRMIIIYHNWMVENILMTDVEHIDVVEPVETTLSRRHLQSLLPKVNTEGIRITYAVAKDDGEEAMPELKCTIIKGYSPRQLQKMFDILNQIY